MDIEELRQRLMVEAHINDMCAHGFERLRSEGMDSLISYYKEMPDWCMERGFPDLKTLKGIFAGRDDTGVFVGKVFHGELLNDLQTYIFHNCRGTIKVGLNVSKGLIPMLYLGNKCRLRIVGVGDFKPKKKSERSVVPVYTFGKNDVSAKDNAYVIFTHHKNELI